MKLLLFTTPICAPCKRYKPIIEAFAERNNIPLEILDVTDEEDSKVFMQYGVRSSPTTVFIPEVGVYTKKVGVLKESELALLAA